LAKLAEKEVSMAIAENGLSGKIERYWDREFQRKGRNVG